MKIKADKIQSLLDEINDLIENVREKEEEHEDQIDEVCPTYTKSSRNLVHYLALRSHDNRKLQKQLRNLGMSRLARANAHVLASLLNSKFILQKLLGMPGKSSEKSGLSIKNGTKLLSEHTRGLLGYRSKGRRVRIMVTMPSESAFDYPMVERMVGAGLNVARINCAHDSEVEWDKMIRNVRKAAAKHKRNVKIAMDLAGPKIRTGSMIPGPNVRKFSPKRDDLGQILDPAEVLLVPALREDSQNYELPVDENWLRQLNVGDRIRFKDTRDSNRVLKVISRYEKSVLAQCFDTSYVGTGTELYLDHHPEIKTAVGILPPVEQQIILNIGDLLHVHEDTIPGEPALYDEEANLKQQAHIGCTLPGVFGMVKPGETIFFDDGKIEGVIQSTSEKDMLVLITNAKEEGSKLKADKGINFPYSNLDVSGLTDKDRKDLMFVAEHSDIVNFSFVNSAADVRDLHAAMESLHVFDELSVILKIETRKAFLNMPSILFEAMKSKYIGVMIARGDLAVEIGWEHIGVVQDEILALCNAAHVPVVWATQVLENLAKKGLPSRSEITDATQSLKAECVMLNKGPHIVQTIRMLDTILHLSEAYRSKHEAMLPNIHDLGERIGKQPV